jgi:hypothetical protein
MAKWTYGSYEFRINPKSFENQMEFVGDQMRTLTGALISQPTGTKETYSVEGTFYQPRTRVVSENSLSAECIDYYNGKLYAVNKTNDRIDVYNSNMVSQSTVSLSAVTNKNYGSISAYVDGIYILSSTAGVSDTIYKINSTTGAIISTTTIPIADSMHITNIKATNNKYLLGLFALRGTRIEKLVFGTLVKDSEMNTPFAIGGTKGITVDGNYIVFGANDGTYGTIYHLDWVGNGVISSMSSDSFQSIDGVTFDGQKFLIFNKANKKIQNVAGNTVPVDIYNLENEIRSSGYATMVDDMGITRKVSVTSIDKERVLGYENMYNISLSVEKVDR